MAGFFIILRLDINKIRWTTSKTNDQIMGGLKNPPFLLPDSEDEQ